MGELCQNQRLGPSKGMQYDAGGVETLMEGGTGSSRVGNARWHWPTLGLPAASGAKGFSCPAGHQLLSRAQVWGIPRGLGASHAARPACEAVAGGSGNEWQSSSRQTVSLLLLRGPHCLQPPHRSRCWRKQPERRHLSSSQRTAPPSAEGSGLSTGCWGF